jgi:hypothetical protein
MASSSAARATGCAVLFLAVMTVPARAEAQQSPQGFALERLYLSAPGGGWFVMDDLAMHGSLGGAVAVTTGYARNPLQVSQGRQGLTLVSDQAFTDLGLAVTYDRVRLYLDLDMPLVTDGQGGTVGSTTFLAPKLDLGMQPDNLSDARVGLDARLLGDPGGPLRLGAGAQLFVPNGPRTTFNTDGSYSGCAYGTDGTYRAMIRALVAGDVGRFSYAGQLGVHVRPLDDASTPGSPRGSELLFGVAAGARLPVGKRDSTAFVVGPEVFGETALRSFLGGSTTGVEGLLTGRLELTGDDGPELRVKLGAGGGLDPSFGAPDGRVVVGIELSDRTRPRAADRDPARQ